MRVLNPYPDADESETQHIKFGSVNLVNRVNIFNAVEPYTDFIFAIIVEELGGELHGKYNPGKSR